MSPTEQKFLDDIPATISRVLSGEIRGRALWAVLHQRRGSGRNFLSNGIALEIVRRIRDGMTRQ